MENLSESLKSVLEYAEGHDKINLSKMHGFYNILEKVEGNATQEKNELIVNHVNAIRSYMKNGEEDADINEAIGRVIKSMKGYNDANYLANNLYDKNKSANAFIGLHEREKMLDQLVYTAERDGLTEVAALGKKLQGVFDDMYKIINGKIKLDDDVLLKKYSHNISSCIKTNDMILTLDNGVTDKNLIGNKGANLVEMHKLGINVPQSLFLTTVACKSIHEQQSISFMPLLKKIMFMFDTDKIAIRSSGVVSMAGMMDTVLDVDRNDDEAVIEAIMSVVNSWDSERAKSFRKVCRIDNEIKVSIVIQGMVRGDKGCSGIAFSRNPNDGKDILSGEYLDKSLGDKIASGEVTPKKIANEFNNISKFVYRELVEVAHKLEKHFKHVQDIEFVNDGQKTFFVQTRNAKLSPLAEIKTLIDFYNEGLITIDEFKARYRPEIHKQVVEITTDGNNELILVGTPAVNGVFTGKVCFDKTKADENSILVIEITTPDDMPHLHKIGGLITNIGGVTSHPAVVCRQLKKPCIVGVKKQYTGSLIEGETITIIGDTGKAYLGEVSISKKQLFVDEVNEILKWEE